MSMSPPSPAEAQRTPSGLRSLALAQCLAVLCAAVATAAYARLLDAAQFSSWASALALAKGVAMLLDGGLKAALIRHEHAADAALLARLRRALLGAGAGTVIAIAAVMAWRWQQGRSDGGTALLMTVYPAAYLLSMPWLLGPLSQLERAQRFGRVGRSEAAALLLEFVAPAGLIALGMTAITAFAVSVVLARVLRLLWLHQAGDALAQAQPVPQAPAPQALALRRLLGAGLGLQAITALALLRDMSHLWLVGPWFGRDWAGQYALAMTVCALATQAAAQTMARVAVPELRACAPDQRWARVLGQSRQLAIWTLPPLALLPLWFALADTHWWAQRWQPAGLLLPWLCGRMVAGVATTTLGAWLSVARSPWHAARAHGVWTLAELVAALAACQAFGAPGLAISGLFTAWVGVGVFLAQAEPGPQVPRRLMDLCMTLLARPSLAVAGALALAAALWPQAWAWWTALLPLAWLAERLATRPAVAPAPWPQAPAPVARGEAGA